MPGARLQSSRACAQARVSGQICTCGGMLARVLGDQLWGWGALELSTGALVALPHSHIMQQAAGGCT
jgi:hypothetical protein